VNAPLASGWHGSAQAGQRHWRIGELFAAPSGGRSIRSNCSGLWTSGTSVSTLRRIARLQRGTELIILLAGGDKSSQAKDMDEALLLADNLP
jgi:hypothetical protein